MSKYFTRRAFTATAMSALAVGSRSIAQEGWNPDLNNPALGFDTRQDQSSRLSGEANSVRRNASAFRGRSNWKNYFSKPTDICMMHLNLPSLYLETNCPYACFAFGLCGWP